MFSFSFRVEIGGDTVPSNPPDIESRHMYFSRIVHINNFLIRDVTKNSAVSVVIDRNRY